MMNYDALLSQLTDEKLSFFHGRSSSTIGAGSAVADVEEGAIEEEQAAVIQNVQPLIVSSLTPAATIEATTGNVLAASQHKMEALTPQRKIPTASNRFMNAFQQFYTGASAANCTATEEEEIDETNNVSAVAAKGTPTKGMESKLLSMWHNVKFGWSNKIKSNFSKEQPVWLLGRCYHRKFTPPSSMETSTEWHVGPIASVTGAATAAVDNKTLGYATNASETMTPVEPNITRLYPVLETPLVDEIVVPQEFGMDAAENQVAENPWEEGIEGFRRDFYSRIWMTYRREFPTMNGSNYTSDCGWGCMLRSGQMMMAQGLICHFLGRTWRYDANTQLHSTLEDNKHKKIIKWFGDSSSKSSPFSIHALVSLGEELGKKPGDWYGPASVSHLLKRALKNAALENADFDNITIYVARDCTIYMQDVEDECCIPDVTPKLHVPWQHNRSRLASPRREKQNWKSLIILIPLRLGTEKLNPIYAHCLKLLLSTEYCIGIMGGRPKHSMYFVGFQEDKLIHLDPHYCQEMVDVNQENFPLQSFHCKSPRKMKIAKMDPSCCIGFYCQTKADFDNFVDSVQMYLLPMRCASGTIDKLITPSQQLPNADANIMEWNYPLFTFSRGRCLDHVRDEMSDSMYKPSQQQTTAGDMYTGGGGNSCDDDDDETEEFVLL